MKSVESASSQAGSILIVEDTESSRTILVLIVKKLGFDVIDCADGKAAWEILGKPGTNVIAIFSDIMMPEMSGIELLKLCRSSEKFKNVPFVLTTAVSDKEHILEAKNNKASGYVLKPVTIQRITSVLKEILPGASIKPMQSKLGGPDRD